MSNKKFSLKDRIKSFGYAFNGLKLFFYTEHNARIHLLAAILALAISFWLKISSLEWVAIIGIIILVFIAEIFNSSIEKLADVVSPEINPKIKIVKDLAAGAVLIAAIFAVIVGLIIFYPKLFP
ncbi:diacylglycerol kinase family protein [Pedobacter aquatilis]|uniref:diacylglycerol kinase family protein n=1 Tax=Pedobacter aquatilis TaxID=351343 RepID=UPI0025B56FFB|nr:diacylglycerol kinase family protein [Pedobacter aquatilis]MDN3588705.1 diacylglycerol kinase family protein [Pedobacter aquatilis]